MLQRVLATTIFLLALAAPLFAQKRTAQYWVEQANKTKEDHLRISYYSQALQIDPTNAQNYVWRGIYKRAVGKYRESLADFDSAVHYQPVYELAFSFRGDSYLQLKSYEKAADDFRKTISINPANDFALSRWAEVDRLQKRSREALARFAQANRLNPRNDFALVRRAALHLEAGQLDSAIYFASATLDINASDDWAWQIRGDAYRQKGELEKAEENLRTAIAKKLSNLRSQVLLAEVLKKQQTDRPQQEKNWQEAINILYQVLEKEPSRADAKKCLAELERLTKYRPLRPKPKPPVFRTGAELVAKVPPPMASRPKTAPLTAGAGLPKSVDYTTDICLPRSQGNQGSCVGFALSYLASYHEKRETGKSAIFSPAFIYHLSNKGQDKGVMIDQAMDIWRLRGICHNYSMPYNEKDYLSAPPQIALAEAKKYKIQGSFPLWTLEELKYQLSIGNPLIISVLADQSLEDVKTAPWSKRYGKADGAHAMLVVGYDDDKGAIKVINSWGNTWGDNGYGWIAYSLFDEVRLQLFVTKDAVNGEEEDYADIVLTDVDPRPTPAPSPRPYFRFGTPSVSIRSGFRNSYTGTLDIIGMSNVPPLSGYFAQIVIYYYDSHGNRIPSQQFPYTTFDGQASHATNVANVAFLGLPDQVWRVHTPSVVFPSWHLAGAAIIAQPVLFIDGIEAAVGPFFQI